MPPPANDSSLRGLVLGFAFLLGALFGAEALRGRRQADATVVAAILADIAADRADSAAQLEKFLAVVSDRIRHCDSQIAALQMQLDAVAQRLPAAPADPDTP